MKTRIWLLVGALVIGTICAANTGLAREQGMSNQFPVVSSPNGKLIAVGDPQFANGYDRKVRLIDAESQREVMRLELPAGEHDVLCGLAFSPDGKLLAWGGYGRIHLFNVPTGERAAVLKGYASNRQSFSFDRSGTLLAAACHDKHVDVWSIKEALTAPEGSTEPKRRLGLHSGPVRSVAFAPGVFARGSQLIALCDDAVFQWDANSGDGGKVFGGEKEPFTSVACAPDNTLLATAEGPRVRLRSFIPLFSREFVPVGTIVRQVEAQTSFAHSAFSPDGRLFAASEDSSVWVWETASTKRLARFVPALPVARTEALAPQPLQVHSFAFTGDGKKLLMTSDVGLLYVWNLVEPESGPMAVIGTTTREGSPAPPDSPDTVATLRRKLERLLKEADDLRKAGRPEEAEQHDQKAAQGRRELDELLRKQASADEQPSENLVINGSFEQRTEGKPNPDSERLVPGSETLVGWQCWSMMARQSNEGPLFLPVDWVGPKRWRASHGQHCLDLDGMIRQILVTTPGQCYQVRFDVAGSPEIGPRQYRLAVVTGEELREFEFDSHGESVQNLGWKSKEFAFIAEQDKTPLIFANVEPNAESAGVALDHVIVQRVGDRTGNRLRALYLRMRRGEQEIEELVRAEQVGDAARLYEKVTGIRRQFEELLRADHE